MVQTYMSVKSLKTLHYVATIMSVAPPYNFENNRAVASKCHKFYGLIGCAFTVAFTLYCLIGRISTTYHHMHGASILVDSMSIVIMTTTSIYVTARLNICQCSTFQEFIHLLLNFDVKSEISVINSRCLYRWKVIMYHVVYFAFCVSDIIFWVKYKSMAEFVYYSNRYLQYYELLTFTFLINNYVLLIRDRFMHLNNLLVNHVTYSGVTHETTKTKNPDCNLKQITALYTALSDIVDLFNRIFGSLLLLTIITIVMGILEPLNVLVVSFKVGLDKHYTAETSYICMATTSILWALVFVVITVLIVVPCQQAKSEGRKTSFISSKLVQSLPPDKQSAMRDDLLFLAKISYQHPPNFDANGFLDIDHGLLAGLVTSITSDLVVLIQLD